MKNFFTRENYTSFFIVLITCLIVAIGFINFKYSNVKAELATKSNEYDTIKASYTDAMALNENVQKELSTTIKDLEEMQDANANLTEANDKLNNDNIELASINDALEAENKEIVGKYTDAMQTRYKYTDLDYEYLLRMAETETYGADMMSKTHVISVALNRAKKYGQSPYAIITAPNQFAYCNTHISQSSIDALEYVLYNGDTAQGALFFHSGGYSATFCGRPCIFGDDVGHYFY
jgi:hypothetical protein